MKRRHAPAPGLLSRRRFALAVGLFAAGPPISSFAKPPARQIRIGFLGSANESAYAARLESMRLGLRDFGYNEGQHFLLESRWADNDESKLEKLAAELVRQNVEIIVTHASKPTRAAVAATSSIPIVIAAGGDPVADGFAKSLARPGANVTGSTNFVRDLSAKRVALIKEILPRMRRVAMLVTPSQRGFYTITDTAAELLKIEVQYFVSESHLQIETAIADATRARCEAVLINEHPLFITNAKVIGDLLSKHKLPSISFREIALNGGMIAYGVNTLELWRRAGFFIDRIANGARPADIPIEQATKFELIVNARTAKALGVTVPKSILLQANEIVE